MAALKLPNWKKMIFLNFSLDNYIIFFSLKWFIWRQKKQQTPRIFLQAWSVWAHIVFFFVYQKKNDLRTQNTVHQKEQLINTQQNRLLRWWYTFDWLHSNSGEGKVTFLKFKTINNQKAVYTIIKQWWSVEWLNNYATLISDNLVLWKPN